MLTGPLDRANILIASVATDSGSFVISADETKAVEANLVSIQHDLVTDIRPIVDFLSKDIKQSGNEQEHIATGFGTIDLNIKSYTNIMSFLSGTQETDFVLDGDATINPRLIAKSLRKNLRIQNSLPTSAHGHVTADMSLKIIGQDMYLTINDASLTVDRNIPGITDIISQAQAGVVLMKGKTVHITIPKNSPLTGATILQGINNLLDILDTESLFTPVKRDGSGGYILAPRLQTKIDINQKIF